LDGVVEAVLRGKGEVRWRRLVSVEVHEKRKRKRKRKRKKDRVSEIARDESKTPR
jgi:hypothetical protein